MIEIVSATRASQQEFVNNTALGQSLKRLGADPQIKMHIALANTRGLPEIYNARIAAADSPEHLVFLHDDVWIDDYFLAQRVMEGLKTFDVIGVAGNRRRFAGQPSWAFVDLKCTWDDMSNLSGTVAHGPSPFGNVARYGPAPAECELLDGVFLAVRKSVLRARGVQFDPAFPFQYYDLDFCRTARQKGLRLGTWPICLTHQSVGGFETGPWYTGYDSYLAKWKE